MNEAVYMCVFFPLISLNYKEITQGPETCFFTVNSLKSLKTFQISLHVISAEHK